VLGNTASDVRLVQVTIPAGKRDTILRALDDEGVDYVVSDEASGREYTGIVYFPLPSTAVEPVLERLREIGVDEDGYTVIVEANTVISRRFEQLQERYDEEEDESRIAREELTARARDLAPPLSTYVLMTVISALIATAGLLLDSPAVVVGSMVIAPLIGPAMAASVGTVMDDTELFRRGVKLQLLGLVVAVASAALFAFFVRTVYLVPPVEDVTTIPEIRERVAPDFLSLVVALGAGVAGVASLSSGVSTALVGVMIAVALLPPAATVGIGLAWNQPLVSLGSGVLLLVNVLSINLAALVVLWYQGYQPTQWFRTDEAKSATVTRIGVLVAAIVVLSVFLGGITLDSFERATTEQDIRTGAEEIIEESGAVMIDIEVEHTNTAVFQRPNRVVVTVGVPPGEQPPSVLTSINQMADRVAGRDVSTQVRYVSIDRT
jgi:uncharacterized hydrophobic protein (TIGR00341 family)